MQVEPAPAPAAPQVSAPRQLQAPPEPDLPAGTEMVTMTVREALRDAMAEEMRRDKAVFVIGEEVAEYQGAYKVTQGLLQEFGAMRVIDTPITEHDPIEQVRSRLLKRGFANEDALKKIDGEVRAIINEAAEFATNDAEPDPAELYNDVYK